MRRVFLLLLLFCVHFQNATPSDFFSNFGGGYSSRSRGAQSAGGGSSDDSFYRLLGVDRSATNDEIKRAYRKSAMKNHPDKGGDAEEFKKLQEAYEVLMDSNKRELYDRYGINGVKGGANGMGGGGGGNPFGAQGNPFAGGGSGFGGFEDLFRSFGASFAVPLVFQLDLSLDDLYTGRELQIPIQVNNGLPSTKVKINIIPGMYGGQELIMRGKIVDARNQPRDLVFRLKELQHVHYTRKGADLLRDIRVSLREALMGFEHSFKLLDGRSVTVKSRPNEVTSPDAVFIVADLGMPIYQSAGRGRLFIRVKIDFPKKMWLGGLDLEVFKELLDMQPGGVGLFNKSDGTESNSTSSSLSKLLGKRRSKPAGGSNTEGKAYLLQSSDIKLFGTVGRHEEPDDDEASSPFTHYFHRF